VDYLKSRPVWYSDVDCVLIPEDAPSLLHGAPPSSGNVLKVPPTEKKKKIS
jgi:hypothetical protein